MLDGWPSSNLQVELLTKFHVIPACVIELDIKEAEVLKRGYKDRHSLERCYSMLAFEIYYALFLIGHIQFMIVILFFLFDLSITVIISRMLRIGILINMIIGV